MKQSILKGLSQICLIVFSVVLGLYLSDRLEDKKNKAEASLLLSKIKIELNENKKLLDYWVPYHQRIVYRLDSLEKDKNFTTAFIKDQKILYKIFDRGTLMSDTPSNDAWDIAKGHPLIVNLKYDQLLAITKIYNQQKSTFISVPKLIDLMLSPDFNSQEKAENNLKSLKNILTDILNKETQLVNYYNQAEEILNYTSP